MASYSSDPQLQSLQARVVELEQENESFAARCERLRESEARYRQVFENAPISIMFINAEGYVTEANQACEALFGATPEQLNTRSIFERPELVENGTLPHMMQAFAGESVVEIPTCTDYTNDEEGIRFFAQGHYAPIQNAYGVVQEIVEIAPDVTALFAARQALQEERDRTAQERANLLSTIAQVANLLLRSPDYTTVLPDVVRLLGEAVGSDRCGIGQNLPHPVSGQPAVKTAPDWGWCKPGVLQSEDFSPHADQLFLWEDAPYITVQLSQGEVVNCLVADLPEPDQSLLAAQGNTAGLFVPILVNHQCWGFIAFDNCCEARLYDEAEIAILKIAADSLAAAIERQAKDDELKRSEALYRSLFEISNEGIWRWALDQPMPLDLSVEQQVEAVYQDLYFAQANDAFARMYGYENAAAVAGLRLSEAHLEGSEKNLAFARTWAEQGYSVRNMETEEQGADGGKRYFLNSVISFTENHHITGGWGTQIDITELRHTQQALLEAEQVKSHLLTTVTTIANQLLRSSDYPTVLPTVLQLLGEAAHADRCSLVQNVTDPQSGKFATRMHTEWCRDGIQASIVHTPALETALLWEDFPQFQARLSRNETISFCVADLAEPARSLLLDQGNVTMAMVPIVVGGEFWGVFGFDYCTEARLLDEADQGIYAIAVDSIAAAIERQQQDDALRNALREMEGRDRLLDATATVANTLLTTENLDEAVNTALQTIGETVDVDRSAIVEFLPKLSNLSSIDWRVSYEWNSPYAIRQIDHPQFAQGKHEGTEMEALYTASCRGQILCCLLEELPESFRSEQAQLGVKALHSVPIFVDGRCWGVVVFDDCREAKRRNPSELAVLKTAAACIGSAIDRDRTQKAILQAEQDRAAELAKANAALQAEIAERRRAEQLARGQSEALVCTSEILAAQPALKNVLNAVLSSIVDGLQFQAGSIWLYDSEAAIVQLNTHSDHPLFAAIASTGRFVLSVSEAEIAELRSRPFILHTSADFAQNPVYQSYVSHLAQFAIGSILTIPLVFGETFLGCLAVCSHCATDFQTEAIDLACALAHQASLAVQLTQLATEAQHVAILEERNRMAREIHDTLAHAFTGILMQLQAAQKLQHSDLTTAAVHLVNASQIARRGLSEARRSVQALRPEALEATDLATALQHTVQQATANTAIQAEVTVIGTPFALPPELELHLLRIGQEALTNALKYAQARSIHLHLTFAPDMIQLQIEDDGQGFDSQALPDRVGFGLLGMRERAQRIEAHFTLTSQVGQGTCITVSVPITR